jgi:hypothetical protein
MAGKVEKGAHVEEGNAHFETEAFTTIQELSFVRRAIKKRSAVGQGR